MVASHASMRDDFEVSIPPIDALVDAACRHHNVFGARLRITTLRAAAGPAVELLEYLTPRDGQPYPGDARANDDDVPGTTRVPQWRLLSIPLD